MTNKTDFPTKTQQRLALLMTVMRIMSRGRTLHKAAFPWKKQPLIAKSFSYALAVAARYARRFGGASPVGKPVSVSTALRAYKRWIGAGRRAGTMAPRDYGSGPNNDTALLEVCAILRRTADALETVALCFPAAPVPEPLPLQDPARNTRRYTFTDHPRILPRGTVPEASKLFDTPAFRNTYRPGDAVEVYCAAGEGYKRIARTLCMPFYKVGVTSRGNIPARFKQHKSERYASFWWMDDRYVADPDFDDQFPSGIVTSLKLSPNSPVRATRNSVVVVMPEGMTTSTFEAALRAKLSHAAIHKWLATDEGLRHCALLCVDPAIGLRMTGYGFGDARRMSPADEIYAFRPRVDGDELLVICEQIVVDSLALANPTN